MRPAGADLVDGASGGHAGAVVIVTSALVAVVTSVAMRGVLYGQLDDQVQQALDRSVGRYNSGFGAPPGRSAGAPTKRVPRSGSASATHPAR